MGRDQALALAAAAKQIVIAKRNAVWTWDIEDGNWFKYRIFMETKEGRKVEGCDAPHGASLDGTLLTALLGPTGNLRAPTLRKGKTLLVGFSGAAYRRVLGD